MWLGSINSISGWFLYWSMRWLISDLVRDAYNLLDARIGLEFKMVELELWSRNLTDTQYYQEFSPGEYVGSPDDVGWRGQPRSMGVAVSVKF